MSGLRQRLVPVVAAVAAVGLFPEAASARVTPTGIAGVEIGMTEDEVRAKLGRPSKQGAEGGGTKRLDYRRRKIDVLLYRGAVIRVRTTSRSQRTATGVRAGLSESAARRKLRGERCSTAKRTRVCVVEHANTIVAVSARRGRVTRVEVSVANL